jgi:hypothetical protein
VGPARWRPAAAHWQSLRSVVSMADQAAAEDRDEDSDSSALPIVIGVVVVVAATGGAFAFFRSRRSADT